MRLQHFCRYHQFIQFSPFLYSIYVSPFIYSIICKSLRQLFILNNRLKIKLLLNVHTDWSWMSPRINWINDLNTIIYLKTLEWMNEQMNEGMNEWKNKWGNEWNYRYAMKELFSAHEQILVTCVWMTFNKLHT